MQISQRNRIGLGVTFAFLLLSLNLWAGEVIPPKPTRYFNDYAGVTSGGTAERLNRQLEDFERTNSSQIVVVIYPKMQSDSSVADYTVRVAQSWAVGQKGKNNGAVLFVFIQDHKTYLQVGYGLEGAIPDAIAKRIIEEQINPRFRTGDFDGGLTAGVNAILQAARGEYRGVGTTVAERNRGGKGGGRGVPVLLIFVVLLLLVAASRRSRGTVYRGSGRSGWVGWPGGWGGGGWGGVSGSGGGGWSSGGGGGFSSGGGSFGGGGAGGDW